MEQFLKIQDYETYSVSNYGNIRNDHTGRILKPGCRGEYFQVILTKIDGKQKACSIHRLVALTFLENPDNKR